MTIFQTVLLLLAQPVLPLVLFSYHTSVLHHKPRPWFLIFFTRQFYAISRLIGLLFFSHVSSILHTCFGSYFFSHVSSILPILNHSNRLLSHTSSTFQKNSHRRKERTNNRKNNLSFFSQKRRILESKTEGICHIRNRRERGEKIVIREKVWLMEMEWIGAL